jgi:hypothetical protein
MAVHSRFDSRNHSRCETFVDEIYFQDWMHGIVFITLISDLHHDSSLRPFHSLVLHEFSVMLL